MFNLIPRLTNRNEFANSIGTMILVILRISKLKKRNSDGNGDSYSTPFHFDLRVICIFAVWISSSLICSNSFYTTGCYIHLFPMTDGIPAERSSCRCWSCMPRHVTLQATLVQNSGWGDSPRIHPGFPIM